jgi:hypothetical protein
LSFSLPYIRGGDKLSYSRKSPDSKPSIPNLRLSEKTPNLPGILRSSIWVKKTGKLFICAATKIEKFAVLEKGILKIFTHATNIEIYPFAEEHNMEMELRVQDCDCFIINNNKVVKLILWPVQPKTPTSSTSTVFASPPTPRRGSLAPLKTIIFQSYAEYPTSLDWHYMIHEHTKHYAM